jgi:hypothetical protein
MLKGLSTIKYEFYIYLRWGYWIIFNLTNSSRRIMGLGFTQPLAEMSTRRYFGWWGKARQACKANNLASIYESTV